jgi:hypothetical protein
VSPPRQRSDVRDRGLIARGEWVIPALQMPDETRYRLPVAALHVGFA